MSDNSEEFRLQFNKQTLLVMVIIYLLLLIYIFYIGVDKVISSLLKANVFLLLIAVLIYYSSLLVRSFRWQYFLSSVNNQNYRKADFWNIYSLIAFSFAINNVFPFRMGELYRPYEWAKKKDYSLFFSYASIILERTFDVVFMGSLIVISGLLQGVDNILNESEIVSNLLLSCLVIGMFVLLLFILTNEKLTYCIIRILNMISGIAQRKIISDEEDTAQIVSNEISLLIRNKRVIFFGSICSIIIWLMEGIVFWIVTISMNISVSLGMAIFILLTSGLIGNSLTSASGLSQLPFMVAQLVLLVGMPQELALSTSIVYLFIVFWLIVPIGFLLREYEKYRDRAVRVIEE